MVLLHTSDLHGRVDRLPSLAAFVAGERRRLSELGWTVLHVDTGDFFQGTPEGDLTDGRVVIDAYNAIGVDAVIPGNHDFDRGPAVTEALSRQSRFPFLAANLRSGRGPPGWVRPSLVRSDLRIEILGLAPDEMDRISTRRAREGLTFESAVTALGGHAWRPGVARLVATHLGIERDRSLPTNGIAAVLGGHTHLSTVEKLPNGTLLSHPGALGRSCARIWFELDPNTGVVSSARGEVVEIPEGRDQVVEDLIEARAGGVRREMEERVGRLTTDLPRGGPDFDGVSSPLGNWIADLAKEKTRADAAVLLRSSIRSSLFEGVVRKRDLYAAVPFPDTIVAVDVSGSRLRSALERAVAGEERILVEVAGIEMAYDRKRPSGRRIMRLEVNGRPLDSRRTYRVATLSFMVEPGGMLSAGKQPSDTGMTLLTAAEEAFRSAESVRPPGFTPRIRWAGRD